MACPDGQRADLNRPSGPRVYNYLTGGTDWFPADKAHAENLIGLDPGMKPDFRELARQNRRFILAATTWAASRGIRQVLDIGSGLPATPAVHDAAPDAVVCYVDLDPVCTMKMRAHYQGQKDIAVARADARDPGAVLSHPVVHGLLDMDQPVTVLLGGTLSAMKGAVARRAVAGFTRALVPESAVVISCVSFADEETGKKGAEALSRAGDWFNHSGAEIAGFFASAHLEVRGGLADLRRWPALVPAGDVSLLGGVAIKERLLAHHRHERVTRRCPLRRDGRYSHGTGDSAGYQACHGERIGHPLDRGTDDAHPGLGQQQGRVVRVSCEVLLCLPPHLGYLPAVPDHDRPDLGECRFRVRFRG